MRVHIGVSSAILATAAMLVSPSVQAQKPCPAPPTAVAQETANMFNSQQEMDLGDAEAEWLQRQYHVIDDPAVTDYLQRLGDRLLDHLPDRSIKYKFVLYDQPIANAFGTTGGRIYVSRKLVAFTRNEDELAGVLGHEIGHMVVHQGARDMTVWLQKVLDVTSVSDRQDVFDKINELLDNGARKPGAFASTNSREESNQLVADRIGMYLVSASGYDSKALVQFWDRFAGTKGKTGSSLSFLFGFSSPDQHRLLEMKGEIASLPGPCGEARPPASNAAYETWKAAVLAYNGIGHRESLHGVIFKQDLNPPLRGDIRFLRFSPDGKYAIAQDDSSIYVLTRDPFQFRFRIDAPEAFPALFSADSATITFYTRGLRVETWNIGEQDRTELHELTNHRNCLQTELSPDGKYLACEEFGGFTMDLTAAINIVVFDVSTDTAVFEKKDFSRPPLTLAGFIFLEAGIDTFTLWNRMDTMRFSPDGHYFIASSTDDEVLAYDLNSEKPVPLPGAIKKFLTKEFVFIEPDRIAGINSVHPNESAIVKFPTGDIVEPLTLGIQNLEAPAHGGYLMLRPIDKYALGVLDLQTKKIFMADAQNAFDVFDGTAIVTHLNGQIALKSLSTKQETANVNLPRGPLAPLRAIALSSDFNWLAISERSRGGVWDLAKSERPFYVRGFQGAYFTPDGSLYADFPKFQDSDRAIGQFNLASHSAKPAYKIAEKNAYQLGSLLLVTKPNKKDGNMREDVTLDLRDSITGNTLWTRQFPNEAPVVQVSPDFKTVLVRWNFSSLAAKNELKGNPEIARLIEKIKRTDSDYLVEVLDAQTGKLINAITVDTNNGSFRPQSIFAVGERLVLSDNLNRVVIYSLSTGKQLAKAFGRAPEVSESSALLAAENELGQLNLFDLATMVKRDELRFPSPIAMKQFSADGKHLFVLTAAQTAYVIDVAQLSKPSTAAAGSAPQ